MNHSRALPTPNWSVLFAAAGLDAAQFKPDPPPWYPLACGDTRAAWEGSWPNHPEIPLRVEAVAYRGKPIFFTLLSPWDKPARMGPKRQTRQNTIAQWFNFGIILTILGFGIWLAAKNVRNGRGDLRGAMRLALFVLVVGLVNCALLAHHVASAMEIVVFILAVSVSLFFGMVTWLLYAALEPYVRRHWPDTLISWSRMLSGKFKDPGILHRFGLVALTVLYFVDQLADTMPLTTPLTAWYTEGGLVGMIAIVAVAFYGFHVSRAEKPLFAEGALDI